MYARIIGCANYPIKARQKVRELWVNHCIVFTDIWTCARVWRMEGVSAVLDHGFVDHGFVARNAE